MKVLVTGGTGVLGSRLVPRLVASGDAVRIMSRGGPATAPQGVELVRGDLVTGRGLTDALAGADAIVHCASSPFRKTHQTDVEGTARLLEAVKGSTGGPPHFVYISIVGVDRIPFGYYQAKFQAESLIESSGLPWTILRTTQFHDLLAKFLDLLARLPVVLLPRGFRYQPIETNQVAERLAELVRGGPAGRVEDMGGPRTLTVRELARSYLDVYGKRRAVVHFPAPGRAAAAFKAGHHLAPEQAVGRRTWQEYLGGRSSS